MPQILPECEMSAEDRLAESAAAGRCLVYSFGVGKDASFENAMADLGCRRDGCPLQL